MSISDAFLTFNREAAHRDALPRECQKHNGRGRPTTARPSPLLTSPLHLL
jgi:hypothetical protein